jgi:L-serine dehydratase
VGRGKTKPMSLSVLDIFKIGIGPSSSHTMGPMNAALRFVGDLVSNGLLVKTTRVGVQLYGSLALTGRGHCTDLALLLGLEGHAPDTLEPSAVEPALQRIRTSHRLRLGGSHEIEFDEPLDVLWHRDQSLPGHSNGMRFTALDANGAVITREEYYSTGGGFVARADEISDPPRNFSAVRATLVLICTNSSLPMRMHSGHARKHAPPWSKSGRSCSLVLNADLVRKAFSLAY